MPATETAVPNRLAELVSDAIELRLRYLNTQQPTAWEAAQREPADNLDENAALARCLTSRNGRLDLDDEDALVLVQRRLKSAAKELERRLAEVDASVV